MVREAPDLPGQWVAHCLDFDVISQGNSPTHAFQMIAEAANMFALHELNAGREPMGSAAPDASWEEFDSLFAQCTPVSGELSPEPSHVYFGMIPMRFEYHEAVGTARRQLHSAKPRVQPLMMQSAST
ncbi:MAG: hypothetical protein HOO96_36015 [Polyangiaceae bacterium]|nr:hypothetical protein [Polyangiaceae bacterium]